MKAASRSHELTRMGLVLASALTIALMASPAEGRMSIRQAFFVVYPNAVGSRLDDLPSIQDHCGVCHFRFTGGSTRNPYGLAVEAALPNFPNTDAGRQAAIRSIENLDSDGDGYAQVVEITDLAHYANTPTFPGLTPGNVNQVTNVNVSEILAYLIPQTGVDNQPPVVTVLAPNGGEAWTGGTFHTVSWTATDNVGVAQVDVFYRDGQTEPWKMVARGLSNTGSFNWPVPNTPTTGSRVRVVARDAQGNQGEDSSNANFTILQEPGGIVPTTLRDFHQPGTQPFGGGGFEDRSACAGCHGGYDPAKEPDRNFQGSMMAQAARDPLFYACLAIAEQDAPSSGDLCLRCHTPGGWMSGRSNPTGGELLNALDRDGVGCDFCHRMVDPIYTAENPAEDQAILAALAEVPTSFSNGQYVFDPLARRRGPFSDAAAPHPFLQSPLHRSSEMCGTCHNVSNPVFVRAGESDYVPGPLDAPATDFSPEVLLPLERTYSEWQNSSFPAGVYAPEFAGNKPDGIVSSCQDCHLRDVSGKGCNDPGAPLRPDLPLHDMTGGNAWIPPIVAQVYPGEVNAAALAEGAARAVSMLQKAALLYVEITAQQGTVRADVTITNRTGHKLPTGYPEGRRMWLNLRAFDAGQQLVYESGAYDASTGVLGHDADLALYEAELGISPDLASAFGLTAGPSFHFALNDSVYMDTRIPPVGFTNAAFTTFGGQPVDPHHPGPGPRYADGQNWDRPSYDLPASAKTVIATLYYQTTSKEYVEFLRDENVTNGAGDLLHDLWVSNGRAAPVAMVRDTADVVPMAVEEGVLAGGVLGVQAGPNPSRGAVEIRVTLPGVRNLQLDLYDVSGRLVRGFDLGMRSGPQSIVWDGRDDRGAQLPAGVYWMRLEAGREARVERVVLIR